MNISQVPELLQNFLEMNISWIGKPKLTYLTSINVKKFPQEEAILNYQNKGLFIDF